MVNNKTNTNVTGMIRSNHTMKSIEPQNKTLDFYRQNDLGYSFCIINYERGHVEIPFMYNDFCNMVTLRFLKELQKFENSNIEPVACNMTFLSIFTDYFALMEQFISTIYIILYYYITNPLKQNNTDVSKMFKEEYAKVLKKIFHIIKVNDMTFKRTQLYNKLAELEDARNYILHGNTGSIKISKTKLPKYPLTINLEDIMEELSIIVNLINYFRYMFPNIDLMPNVAIWINNGLIYKKIDVYLYNVLSPLLNNILTKHSLCPTKNISLYTRSLPKINFGIAKNILIYIKAVPESKFQDKKSIKNTDIFSSLLPRIISHAEFRNIEGKFQLPQFMLSEVRI